MLERSMGRVNDTIANVNSAFRNLLLLVLVGGAGYGGYKAYDLYNEPNKQLAVKEKQLADKAAELEEVYNELSDQKKQIGKLNNDLTAKVAENERLQVAMKLLRVYHRLARLTVLDQHEIPPGAPAANAQSANDTGPDATKPKVVSKIEFVEINDQGDPIGKPKRFDIAGDLVYIDYWTVNFEDKYVEKSDIDRSTSLALFRRIFGEHQEPIHGFELDTVGSRPTAYSPGSQMSDFEKRIWNDFWLIANDRKRAAELGIHAIQGKAVSMRVQAGKIYEIELRSTGNMTIRPVEPNAGPMTEAKSGS
jgi:regulator of replication initiation timing